VISVSSGSLEPQPVVKKGMTSAPTSIKSEDLSNEWFMLEIPTFPISMNFPGNNAHKFFA
jgi:hypothetical protein